MQKLVSCNTPRCHCHGLQEHAKNVWRCSYCEEKGTRADAYELKLFKMYVDNIVCTVKRNPLDYLEYAIFFKKTAVLY